jgi:hypothetical protein
MYSPFRYKTLAPPTPFTHPDNSSMIFHFIGFFIPGFCSTAMSWRGSYGSNLFKKGLKDSLGNNKTPEQFTKKRLTVYSSAASPS